jgi:transcriptional regulator with XRE-family HTH domain
MVTVAQNDPDPVDVQIGARVRNRRKALGLSQTELGHRIGVTFQQVQKYERGVNRISGSTLVRVAKGLETTVGILVGEPEAEAEGDEAKALVRAFSGIQDPKLRGAVVEFVTRLGDGG